MVLFPNCKINLGLDVLRRRPDGFHDIETLMLPVRGLTDVLEVVSDDGERVSFIPSGLALDCPPEKNLCLRAYELMCGVRDGIGNELYAGGQRERELSDTGSASRGSSMERPGVRIYLHKTIPFGAGLGGGSADAAYMIRALNDLWDMGLSQERMETLAAQLGSDTTFFIRNVPALATGRGEVLNPFPLSLEGKMLVIVKPEVAVSTAQAYAAITPRVPAIPLSERLSRPLAEWRHCLTNDFEAPVFSMYPLLARIKERLYAAGAVYAAMSGSGAALFGIFDACPEEVTFARELSMALKKEFGTLFVYCERME